MSTLLLCSGGSSLKFLDTLDPTAFDQPLTVTVLDERLSDDSELRNFDQLLKTSFAERARAIGATFKNVRSGKIEGLGESSDRFEASLREWKQKNPDGKIVAIMGIGADGHTAGIAPMPDDPEAFEKLFNDPARWVVGYDAGSRLTPPQRITVTLSFLRNTVDQVYVYARGKEKEDAIVRVRAEHGSLAEMPARIIREMKDVTWQIV